jgi:hypothetical protein
MRKNILGGHIRHTICAVFALAIAFALVPAAAPADGVPSGLNFGLGLGAHIPSDDQAYGDIGADLYPELQLMYDISGFRLGGSVGFVYRDVEEWGYSSYGGSYGSSYEQSFVPLKFNIAVLPVRFAKPDFVFQPYVGFGVGTYIATGDNDEDLTIVSANGGFQFEFSDWYNLSLDFAYNDVSEPEEGGYNGYYSLGGADLSYTTIMLVNRFRIPFSRSR